jgi:prophage regulatory protein
MAYSSYFLRRLTACEAMSWFFGGIKSYATGLGSEMQQSMQHLDGANRLIRLPEVIRLTGVSRSLVYAKIKPSSKWFDKNFPRQVKISKRAVAWPLAEIQMWVNIQKNQSSY